MIVPEQRFNYYCGQVWGWLYLPLDHNTFGGGGLDLEDHLDHFDVQNKGDVIMVEWSAEEQ